MIIRLSVAKLPETVNAELLLRDFAKYISTHLPKDDEVFSHWLARNEYESDALEKILAVQEARRLSQEEKTLVKRKLCILWTKFLTESGIESHTVHLSLASSVGSSYHEIKEGKKVLYYFTKNHSWIIQ